MKITSISKAAIALGINALVLGGLVAGPASADPPAGVYADLVGTGSDTTQDIMNGLSTALGENPDTGNRYIASYDAAPGDAEAADCNTADDKITPQEEGVTFVRPNGSSNGRDTLRTAIGQASTASIKSYACGLSSGAGVTLTAAAHKGVVQFARSSSGPGATDTRTSGVLAYVPFAKDAMTVAVSATTKIPALTFGTSSVNTSYGGVTGKVEPTLYALYTCKATQVIVPTSGASFLANADYVTQTGDVATPINVYIPQAGSGTRAFWIAKFGVTEANISDPNVAKSACLDDTIDTTPNVGVAVQEHSGLAVGSDNYAVTPHSIPTYVAQNNGVQGVTSRINGAVLHPIGAVNPTNGTGTSKVMNPTYLTSSKTSMLGRLMYNIVPSRTLDDPSSLEHDVFAGQTSLICQETATISEYGYGLLTATTGSSSCGYTGLRAYDASSTTFTIDVVDAATSSANAVTYAAEGDTVVFRVKLLTTTGNGGGVVQLNDGAGNVFAEFELDPAEITSTTSTWEYFEVTLDENLPAGEYLVNAVFVPTLPGAATATTANLISFSLDQREIDGMTLELFTSTYKVGKKGKLGVEVEAEGVYPTGTVTVKNGNKVLGSATLAEYNQGGAGGNIAQRELATAIANLKKFTKKGQVTLTIEYSGDTTYLPYETTTQITVK